MTNSNCLSTYFPTAAVILIAGFASSVRAIEPWQENPWYWSHGNQPVLLLGGSDDDNLFQWPKQDLVMQLGFFGFIGKILENEVRQVLPLDQAQELLLGQVRQVLRGDAQLQESAQAQCVLVQVLRSETVHVSERSGA